MQEDIHSRLENALGKIWELDYNNLDLQEEVEEATKDLETLEYKTYGNKNPGVAVNGMLKKMAAERVYTTEDIQSYAKELWLTAE